MNKEKLQNLIEIIDQQLLNYDDYDGDTDIDKGLQELRDDIECLIE